MRPLSSVAPPGLGRFWAASQPGARAPGYALSSLRDWVIGVAPRDVGRVVLSAVIGRFPRSGRSPTGSPTFADGPSEKVGEPVGLASRLAKWLSIAAGTTHPTIYGAMPTPKRGHA